MRFGVVNQHNAVLFAQSLNSSELIAHRVPREEPMTRSVESKSLLPASQVLKDGPEAEHADELHLLSIGTTIGEIHLDRR